MTELMPEDYQPTRHHRSGGSGGGNHRELHDAITLALSAPGRWVRVGPARFLAKPPSSWVSEVNRQDKKALEVDGGTWEATYERTGNRDGERDEYIKLIRLTTLVRSAESVAVSNAGRTSASPPSTVD